VIAVLVFGLIAIIAVLLAVEIRVRALLKPDDDDPFDFPDRSETPPSHRARK
jgi:hypothetical protein